MTPAPTVPTLTDGVVVLRAHTRADAPGVVEQCVDPLSREWTTVPLDYTYRDALEFVGQTMPAGWADDSEWGFAVEAQDDEGTPRFAGTVSLRNERVRRAEVAYGSHPWVRGRGVMERALRLLVGWGFSEKGLETVSWWANRGNWASRRLAWKVGFRIEGGARQWLVHRGELRDGWMGTLRSTDVQRPSAPWLDVPRIVTPVLALRRVGGGADLDRIVEACADPEVRRWLGQIPQPFERHHAVEFLEERQEALATGTGLLWAIADPADDGLVGLVSLNDIKSGMDAEMGYWVHPAARGRGLATEAARRALRHAFVPTDDGGLGLARVRALAALDNTTSRRVLERAGMTLQGQERRAVIVEGGRLADAALYDMVAAELR